MKKVSGDDISKACKKYCEKEVPGIGAADEKETTTFRAALESWTADFVQSRCEAEANANGG